MGYRCICGAPAMVRITEQGKDITLGCPCAGHLAEYAARYLARYALLTIKPAEAAA